MPVAASGERSGEAPEMVTTLEQEAALEDVEARPIEAEALTVVDASLLGARTAGALEKSPSAAVRKPALEAATGPYTGRLVDSLGRPMKDVTVFVESWEDASRASDAGLQFNLGAKRKRPKGTTGDDGKFEVSSKDSLGRSVGVSATIRGYSEGAIKCVLDPEKGRELGDVTLEPAVIVTGWVRDEKDRPVEGARVRRVDRSGDGTADMMDQLGFGGLVGGARTDADGRFELLHEDEGLITLQVDGDEILSERWDGPTKRAGEVVQDIVVVAQRAGQIRGMVVGYPKGRKRGMVAAAPLDDSEDDSTGSGMSELMAARLAPAGDHTGKIEADGSFVLPGLVPGARYRVRAIAKQMFVNTIELSQPEDASAGGSSVTLQFDPGVTVTFQAIDRKTKKPVEAMSIAGRYGDEPAFLQLTETASDPPSLFPGGKVTLYELRPEDGPQTLHLSIDADGYFRNSSVVVDVPESGTVNLGKVEMDAAPLLKFRVVDAVTRKPVRRARVTVDPMDAPAVSPAGSLGGDSGEPGGDEEATDEEKEDQAAAEEMLFGQYRVRSRGRTDREGYCPLSMVSGDFASLEVKARGYGTHVVAPFFVPEDDEDEIVIELFGGGTLQVSVTDTGNAPAVMARVECRREVGGRTVKKGMNTDDNGFAEFEHLAVGPWEVRAFRADNSPIAEGGPGSAQHPAEWVKVNLRRNGEARVDLSVPELADLSGIVMLGNRPSADARVMLSSVDGVERSERLLELQGQFAGLTSGSSTGISDFEGRFMLTDVVPGDYIILTRHPDLAMVIKTEVTVEIGENDVTILLPSTSLEGRVLDDDGAPVVGASVSVEAYDPDEDATDDGRALTREFLSWDDSTSAKTDLNGAYRLVGVDSEVDLFVMVRADGYADSKSEPVKAAKDEVCTVPPIALERAGTIEVTSTESTGFVRAKPTGGRALNVLSGSKVAIIKGGRARIKGLVPGTWEVTIQSLDDTVGGVLPGPKTVEVGSGETVEVEL